MDLDIAGHIRIDSGQYVRLAQSATDVDEVHLVGHQFDVILLG